MSRKFSSLILVLAFSLVGTNTSGAQSAQPVVFNTLSRPIIAKLTTGEAVAGRLNLTLTAANDDDTITGTIVFAISDDARQKIADASGKALTAIPASFLKKDVIANFRKGTACPIMHIEIPQTEIEAADIRIRLERTALEINETQGQVAQLICAWTRQINANRQHRGIIAAINRLIVPEQ
jgi:hypothetical protein